MNIVLDWLEMLFRWGHVMAGITWIGTSFYFNWFDLSVRKASGTVVKENVRGTLHEVHGGSFYYHEQYWPSEDQPRMLAHAGPAQLTFLTGAVLMLLIYWLGASVYLIDPSVRDLTPAVAIAISAGSIATAWFGYHLLCRITPNDTIVFLVMGLVATFAAWFFGQMFGARAAYIHVGAMLGTIMATNVHLVIIPNHIAMINQVRAGEPLNKAFGGLAKRRSQHNNYFTLPVVFSMLSIHFPLAYTHRFAWVILSLVMLSGVALRHYRNIVFSQEKQDLPSLAVAAGCLIAACALTFIPAPTVKQDASALSDPEDKMVFTIMQDRCTSCHSSTPTSEIFTTAPLGFNLDTIDQLRRGAEKVMQRAVLSNDMPINNMTGMTDAERKFLGDWLQSNGLQSGS